MALGLGRRALWFATLTAAAAFAAGPAAAAAPCWRAVQNDWVDGRIEGVYPIPCYREAIARLPADLRMYSSAEEDITRALQARVARYAAKPRSGVLSAAYSGRASQSSSSPVWATAAGIAALSVLTLGLAVYVVRRLRQAGR